MGRRPRHFLPRLDVGYLGLRQRARLDQQLRWDADRLRRWFSRSPGLTGEAGRVALGVAGGGATAPAHSIRPPVSLLPAAGPASLTCGFAATHPLVPALGNQPRPTAV